VPLQCLWRDSVTLISTLLLTDLLALPIAGDSWVASASPFVATQLNWTQLDVELSWVELRRYKRAFSHLRSADQHKLLFRARLHRRSVHGRSAHRARCLGTLFPRSFVTSHLNQHLQTIPGNSSLQQQYSDWLRFILHRHVFCFLGFRHWTRCRDSFCLAIACFKNVCLLTYLLTYLLTSTVCGCVTVSGSARGSVCHTVVRIISS